MFLLQMIYEAIDALNQGEGANKSTISKFIESKYHGLPPAHSNLLSANLARMKDNGELVFMKNNYLRAGPSAPPRRGRGRPPKPREPGPPSAEIAPPRPRGRPKKDPNAPPTPKKPKVAATPPSMAAPVLSKTGRPRGRPRKVRPQAAAQNGIGMDGS